MKAHDKLRDITHQIVKPVVNSSQNVNWFIVVSEKHRITQPILDSASQWMYMIQI